MADSQKMDGSRTPALSATERPGLPGALARGFDSDIFHSFKQSKVTMLAGAVTAIYFLAALFAPWIAPHDP